MSLVCANMLSQVIAAVGFVVILAKLGAFEWLYKRLRCIYYMRKLPMATPPLWFTGHTYYALPENVTKSIMDVYSDPNRPTLGGIGRMDMAPFVHFANVESPETVGAILRSSEPKNPYIYSFLLPWIGEGLLISNGKKWARNRRLLTPAFHFDVLNGYADVYSSAVEILAQKWLDAVEALDGASARVPVSADVTLLTLDVILRCAMSYHSDCQTRPNDYTDAVMTLITTTQVRGLNVLHHPDFVYHRTDAGKKSRAACATAHSYAEDIISQRKQELAEGRTDSNHSTDFLDILLTARDTDGAGLSDEDIRNEVDTFLFEGHDTTASALQWTLYYVAGNPAVQERCRQEARDVLCKGGSAAPNVTYESLQSLLYIGQVIKEAMRLATTVPLIYRRLSQDVQIGGYLVPEYAWVVVNLWAVHHNPDVWENPMQFDPSRFDPGEASTQRPVFSYVPFSGGPRNCIGQNLAMEEMKSAVALLLLNFQLEQPDDMRDMGQMIYAINRPRRPIELLVKPLDT